MVRRDKYTLGNSPRNYMPNKHVKKCVCVCWGVRMSISIVIVSWCIATPRHNHDCEYESSPDCGQVATDRPSVSPV